MKKLLFITLLAICNTISVFSQTSDTNFLYKLMQNGRNEQTKFIAASNEDISFSVNITYIDKTLNIKTTIPMTRVSLYNVAGTTLYDAALNSETEVSIHIDLADGVYVVILRGADYQLNIKIVIKNNSLLTYYY